MHDPETTFIEQLGFCAAEDGLPRIAGRLWGYLLLHGGAHALDELAAELKVSKASASTNARLLERAGMIVRTSMAGDRRDYYELPAGQWAGMLAVVRRKLERMHDLLAATSPCVAPGKCERLREAQRFYAFLLEDLDERIERWRAAAAEG